MFYLSANLQMIYHRKFLINGLVFPQINIKPNSTHGNLKKPFYNANRYEKYSITVSKVKSWN